MGLYFSIYSCGQGSVHKKLLDMRNYSSAFVSKSKNQHIYFCGHQDFKMASLVPLKEKLMEVKLGELDTDAGFHPSGTAGVFRRGCDPYDIKSISVQINMVLAAYVVFSSCVSYEELKREGRRQYH